MRGPWKVYVRWLTDSVKFNEWMNPIDYELDEEAQAELSAGADVEMSEAAAAPSSTRSQSDLAEPSAGTFLACTGEHQIHERSFLKVLPCMK